MDILLPVLEAGTVLAAQYCKACGRDCIVAEDMRYGLMFAARNVVGKQVGSLFPEVYEEEGDSGSDSDDVPDLVNDEESESEEEVWTRYSGDPAGTEEVSIAAKMNACADSWDSWEPESPAEFALKRAIDKQREG